MYPKPKRWQLASTTVTPLSTLTLSVHNEIVEKEKKEEKVPSYKYLSTILDNKLTFQLNTEHIFSKCQLRKLCKRHVHQSILAAFCTCFIEPILTFSITGWFGTLTDRNTLNKIISISSKIIGQEQQSLPTNFNTRVRKKGKQTASDHSHTLNTHDTLLPSGRRYRSLPLQTSSFLPTPVCMLNRCF